MTSSSEQLDFAIIGAGLSGIGAAVYYLRQYPGANRPQSQLTGADKRFAVFEGRSALGGTWDLFRYPGIRSDSDMKTFAFSFNPWLDHSHSISPGALIRDYIGSTARDFGVAPHVRFNHRARTFEWNSSTRLWTITFDRTIPSPPPHLGPAALPVAERSLAGGEAQQQGQYQQQHHQGQEEVMTERVTVTARFLMMCTGYYQYDAGFTPSEGAWATLHADFKGRVVHPQHWPEDLDYAGKRVVVIGSGATAVTVVPAMASKGAAHVTMLQRSPTWLVSLPVASSVPFYLKWLPARAAARILRFSAIFFSWAQFQFCRAFPGVVAWMLHRSLQRDEGLSHGEIARHFTPRYNIWDERACVVTDGDMFAHMRAGRVSVVTGTIDRFVANGVQLAPETPTDAPPRTLDADIIVTATGLNLQLFGGAELIIDGARADIGAHLVYRGCMLSGVPNMAIAIGYTNASWTLKIELAFRYVMRLLARMDAVGAASATPVPPRTVRATERGIFELASNYVRRGKHLLPKQGSAAPWVVLNSYPRDILGMAYGSTTDGCLAYA